jgi:S-adenosyl-L-methionine hydrolase (adenosine-forming)
MIASGIVTLTTDFGTRDPYVGTMKARVLTANPNVRLVDITHEIPARDITVAAFTIARSYEFFPEGTIHVVVVDPDVGDRRKNIAILTRRHIFVGPDNGSFAMVLAHEKPLDIREIKNPPFLSEHISNTFHGRDIFAPCAGHLSAGRLFEDIGPELQQIRNLKYPRVTQQGNILTGEVVSVDSFGNMITNISEHTFLSFVGKHAFEIYFATERFDSVMKQYNDAPKGTSLLLFGSSGHLEISMNSGSAEEYFMTSEGSAVTVRRY